MNIVYRTQLFTFINIYISQHHHFYNNNNLTIGIDSKLQKNNSLGLAFNLVSRDSEIGSDKAYIDTEALNIVSYASMMLEEKEWFDTLLGFGNIDFDIDRKVSNNFNSGTRDGQQIFSSFKYTKKPKKNFKNDLSYFSRLDLGFTKLEKYTETGTSNLIHFNKQNIKQASFGVGSNLSRIIEVNKGFFIPFKISRPIPTKVLLAFIKFSTFILYNFFYKVIKIFLIKEKTFNFAFFCKLHICNLITNHK